MKGGVAKIKKYIQEVIRIKTTPHSLALGFAIGTFISIVPTPGFNVLLGLLVVLLFKKVSKLSLFAAMALWNPLSAPPIYYASFKVGDFLLGNAPTVEYQLHWLNAAYNFTRRFLIGNLIIATVVSSASYPIVWLIATKYKQRKGS